MDNILLLLILDVIVNINGKTYIIIYELINSSRLTMNRTFIRTLKVMRKVATSMVWIC